MNLQFYIEKMKASEAYKCNECELLALCGQCPGWAQMEHNDSEKPVDFLCRVAHLRAETFGVNSSIAEPAK